MVDTHVDDIKNHIDAVSNLKDQFLELSNRSLDRFNTMLALTNDYQERWDSLYRQTGALRTQQNNIEAVSQRLNHIQSYLRTPSEVENVIQQGPERDIASYLKAMDRIAEAYDVLMREGIRNVEFSRLQGLFSLGNQNINSEFENLLKRTFSVIRVEMLVNSEQLEPHNLQELETASQSMLESIRLVATWVSKQRRGERTQQPGNDRSCLSRYQDYRRERLCKSLARLRDILVQQEVGDYSSLARTRTQQRARGKRPPGYVWDVNARRQINDNENEELNSEHLSICLAALIRLIENERRWFSQLGLTSSQHEEQVALDMILKVACNDIITDINSFNRLMERAQTRAEYHMLLSLLVVLKKFARVGMDLRGALQGIDHILFDFNNLVLRLLQRTGAALEAYTEFLRHIPDHLIASKVVVPRDGTVHELTTNVLMFLENILEFDSILAISLSHVDSTMPDTNQALVYFCTNAKEVSSEMVQVIGSFIYSAVSALLTNLDRKSEAYGEDVIRLVFQMNNIQYILKTVQSTRIKNYDRGTIDRLDAVLTQCIGAYSRWCQNTLFTLNALQLSHYQNRGLEKKQRSDVKSTWNDFNNGVASLSRQHASLSIADQKLRDMLVRKLLSELLPLYENLYGTSMKINFTNRRAKYILYSVEEFAGMLHCLFTSGSIGR